MLCPTYVKGGSKTLISSTLVYTLWIALACFSGNQKAFHLTTSCGQLPFPFSSPFTETVNFLCQPGKFCILSYGKEFNHVWGWVHVVRMRTNGLECLMWGPCFQWRGMCLSHHGKKREYICILVLKSYLMASILLNKVVLFQCLFQI